MCFFLHHSFLLYVYIKVFFFFSFFFFFNDTATTEIYTLSLTTLFRSGRAARRPPPARRTARGRARPRTRRPDRKSTRLNSSHANISYAVFCLKKKKTRRTRASRPSRSSRFVSQELRWSESRMVSFFFFNDTATTEIYTLSLHDALPISAANSAAPNTTATRDSHVLKARTAK